MTLSPICLFVYKRLDLTIKTVTSLKGNLYANESDLFIFSDAPKNDEDQLLVLEVRKYIKSIVGFKS
ncbi:MAG: sugar transferase, partial [Bacteroidetes bacterium]|nr:sugar transferase [Bacteroidota bacterium]